MQLNAPLGFMFTLLAASPPIIYLLIRLFINRVENVSSFRKEYDYIVVGGGSAGSVVASRLSEDERVTVLLLEAGGDEWVASEIPAAAHYNQRTVTDWQYVTEPSNTSCLAICGQKCLWPRGKVIGGSSTINYMMYVRGNKKDYDLWADLGNPGWTFEEVLPYFLKMEDYHGEVKPEDARYHSVGGPLTVTKQAAYHSKLGDAFLEAAKELGHPILDVNGQEQMGFAHSGVTERDGLRCSTAKGYVKPSQGRPNLDVSIHSLVTKILFEGNVASGVSFEKNGIRHTVQATKEVIISGGTINSPQLLMLSGIGPRKHLEEHEIKVIADLPGVGENLQDHPSSHALVFVVNTTDESYSQSRFLHHAPVWDVVFHGSGPLTTSGVDGIGFISTGLGGTNNSIPDIQIHFLSSSVVADPNWLRHVSGICDKTWNSYIKPLVDKDTITIHSILLHGKSRGKISLKSTDPHVHPYVDHNYFKEDIDMKTIVAGMRFILKLAKTQAFQRYGATLNPNPLPGCENLDLDSDEFLACGARQLTFTYYHPVGTCKMGVSSDPNAVVDARLRVYGVKRLRVVDASIMPEVTSGNTNIPCIMIGEKASDMIKQDDKRTLKK